MCTSTTALADALDDERALEFAKHVKLSDYGACTPEQRAEVRVAYDRAVTLLHAHRPDAAQLEPTVQRLIAGWFHQREPDHWLRLFHNYDHRPRKFEHQFRLLAPYLRGERIADIGCGAGHLARVCADSGYQLATTDVLDYRGIAARELPFQLMQSAGGIPLPTDAADTALVFSVLHHVEPEHLGPLLIELRRVASRVIVCEDVYDFSADDDTCRPLLECDPLLRDFITLTSAQQRHVLALLDYFSNVFDRGHRGNEPAIRVQVDGRMATSV